MTVQHDFVIPQFTMGDRMRRAMQDAGYSVNEAAEYLDVNRHTVSRWINDTIVPPMTVQRLWAMWTGVPFTWLHTGEKPAPDGDGLPLPRLDSNQEPADYRLPSQDAHIVPFSMREAA